MNTGQMMLTVGAIVLLGITVLTLNRSSLQNGVMLQQTQIGIYAISLATSMIEEASGKAFDQNTDNNAVSTTASLTSSSLLGAEAGETTNPPSSIKFNDFDDYNYFNRHPRIDTASGVDVFTTRDSVYYVNDSLPNIKVTGPTWYKRMDVMVYGSGVADTSRRKFGLATGDTIKMSYIFSYFFFR
jgi:hypothetical protein